jgi:hypothetical protein
MVGRLTSIKGSAEVFDLVLWGVSAMTDERQKRAPNPHLQTRPATIFTAIGLCVLIMIIQLVPALQDVSAPLQGTTKVSSAR